MVYIHDKNPRKPLREGPKAQEKYIESIHEEWIDNHATKDFKEVRNREQDVPENIRLRYEEAELQTRMRMIEEQQAWLDKTESLARVEVLALKAAWEVKELGHIREATRTEMIELNLDPDALGVPVIPLI
jgi:hypothetical protein